MGKNEVQIFENSEFGQVRTVDVDGKTYFVANDVAKALGYSVPKDAITRHCKGALKYRHLTLGGEQEIKIIPEGDIYRLVIKSQLPSAERFERWIFDEVLPSIRKTGGYIVGQDTLSDDELIAKALMVAQNKIAERDKVIAEKQECINQMKPKEVFADAIMSSHTTILVGELAKLIKQNGYDIGQNRLFAWLRENGYLISRKGTDYNMPTQRSMEQGLFEIKESTSINSDGSIRTNKTPKVTGKGQHYFVNKFLGDV